MGSPCLFTRQQSLKLGYFYWLRVKHSNPLLTELSLCYLKHTKFYLEHKASFIQISSITSFNSFLVACCGDIVLFRTVPWLAWSPRLDPNTPNTKLFSPKKSCSTIKLFFFFKYVLYWTVLSKYLEKKSGVTVLVSSQSTDKGGHGFEIAVRMDNLRGGDWGEIQNNAHRFRSMHSRSSLFFVFFISLISSTQKFKLEKNTLNTKEWGKSRIDEILELWIFILDYFVAPAFCF